MKKLITIAFVCTHNSCRSQMAEAITKITMPDFFLPFSAGTTIKSEINMDAVRIIQELYSMDTRQSQRPKLIDELPKIDVLVTMGCNVNCPYLPCQHREDWGLEDPTGQKDEAFKETIRIIIHKLADLKNRIESGEIKIS